MRLRTSLLALLLVLAAAAPALADTLITSRTTSDGLAAMGQPAVDETSTVWLGNNAIREDRPDQSVIVNLDANRIFVLNHARLSYQQLELPLDIRKMIPAEMIPAYEEIRAGLKMDVVVTPAQETREIMGHAAARHDVALKSPLVEMTLRLWITEDLDFNVEAFKRMTLELGNLQPAGNEWLREIMAIPGFPMLKEMVVSVMDQQMTTREEIVSIETKTPPEGTYLPPGDYAEEPFDFTAMLPGG